MFKKILKKFAIKIAYAMAEIILNELKNIDTSHSDYEPPKDNSYGV